MTRRAVLLAALLLACKREPAPARTPPPAPPPAAADVAASAPAPGEAAAPVSAFRETARFLPQGTAVTGWRQSGAVRLVDAQHLYELIDGAAEKYVSYGFRQLARTDYRAAQGSSVVTVEIYDMAADLGAFGQYSMILSDGRDPLTLQSSAVALGGGGFLGATQLVFWKGRYLVQVNLTDEGDDADEAAMRAAAREALPRFGERLAAALEGGTLAPPPPPGITPEGLVWGGLTYLANSAFGAERTGAAWIGHYRGDGNARYRLAVLPRTTPDEARAAFTALRSAGATAVAGLGDEAFTVRGAEGELVVARVGTRVVVVADPVGAGLTALPLAAKQARLRAALSSLR
ncbi:MAG: DUF6599 family protein [Polyangiales bacterium]